MSKLVPTPVLITRFLLPVVMSGALLAGCQTSSSAPTPAEIGDGLLTVSDLESDWRETQRDIFDERAVENPVLDTGSFCPAAEIDADELESLAGRAGADAEFQKKDGSEAVRLQAWSNADSVTFDDMIAAAAIACDAKTWTDEFGTTGSFEVIDGPELGDSSLHWSTVMVPSGDKGEKAVSSGRTSVVRFGDVVMILQWGSFGGDPVADVDETWWSELVGEAYEKLNDAL